MALNATGGTSVGQIFFEDAAGHFQCLIFFIEKKSRLLRNDVPYFNQCGVDGLIVKKRLGQKGPKNSDTYFPLKIKQIFPIFKLATLTA